MYPIDPDLYEESLEKMVCRPMGFIGKPMKGWVMIEPAAMQKKEALGYWIELDLANSVKAPSNKKKTNG